MLVFPGPEAPWDQGHSITWSGFYAFMLLSFHLIQAALSTNATSAQHGWQGLKGKKWILEKKAISLFCGLNSALGLYQPTLIK